MPLLAYHRLSFLLLPIDFRRGGLSRVRMWEVGAEPLLPVHGSIGGHALVLVAASAPSSVCRGAAAAAKLGSVPPCGKPRAAAAQSSRRRTDERTGGRRGLTRLLTSPRDPPPRVGYLFLRYQPSAPFSASPVRRQAHSELSSALCCPGGWENNPHCIPLWIHPQQPYFI